MEWQKEEGEELTLFCSVQEVLNDKNTLIIFFIVLKITVSFSSMRLDSLFINTMSKVLTCIQSSVLF